jgi:hypothetical protein
MNEFPPRSFYPSVARTTNRKIKIQMNTIIETFTSVPSAVTLQHSIEAIKIFGPLALVAIATYILTKTK